MPAIGDLERIGCPNPHKPGIGTGTVACDHGNARVTPEPGVPENAASASPSSGPSSIGEPSLTTCPRETGTTSKRSGPLEPDTRVALEVHFSRLSNFDSQLRRVHPCTMPNQVSRNVSLTAELDAFIGQEVASGRFQNSSEVVRAALRLMADHEVHLMPRTPRPCAAREAQAQTSTEADNREVSAA
jgi:antitoxin ParD1/3/4